MPAIDNCDPSILRALEKEGWSLIRRHYLIRLGKQRSAVYADMYLEKNPEKILIVEIKCFADKRQVLDNFYHSVGQYMVYFNALRIANENVDALYLALPTTAYQYFEERDALMQTIKYAKIKLIIVNLETEVVEQWLH